MDFTEVNVSITAESVPTIDNQILLVHQDGFQADNEESLPSSSLAAADVHLDLTKMLCIDSTAAAPANTIENAQHNHGTSVPLEVTVTALTLTMPCDSVTITTSPEGNLPAHLQPEAESESDSEENSPVPNGEINLHFDSTPNDHLAVDESKDFEISTVVGSCREQTAKDDDEFAFESQSITEHKPLPSASLAKPSTTDNREVSSESKQSNDNTPQPSTTAGNPPSHIVVPDTESVSMAANEWAAVQEVTPDVRVGASQVTSDQPIEGTQTQLVVVDEVLSDCRHNAAHLTSSPDLHTTSTRHGFAAFIFRLFGTKMHANLLPDRKLVFGLGACPFSNDNKLHHRVLQTLYRKLTGSRFDCPRFGSHWEVIGFQGNDPSTDLRSAGFLGLLQLLFLVTDPRTQTLAKQIYKLSLHVTQNFPFCVMGINITRICLQTLREDKLNKICNKHGDVFEPFNLLFAAAFLHMYEAWKNQHKTIADSGFLIRDLDLTVKKQTQSVYNHLFDYLAKEKASGSSAQHATNQSHASGEPFMTRVTWQQDDDDN